MKRFQSERVNCCRKIVDWRICVIKVQVKFQIENCCGPKVFRFVSKGFSAEVALGGRLTLKSFPANFS